MGRSAASRRRQRGDTKYAYELGKVCGIETKATGSNWAFAPIVDLVTNWHNPGIAVRGWGADADMVLEMSKEYFRGISESGIVCAMKHFPGDGSDERDPHIATSVNALSCEEWDNTYGKVYRGMIEAGVQSIMPGHIMMPAYQKFFSPETRDEDLKPATLSKEILGDLLRGKLGFNGLIVSDASHMVGLTGRAKRRDLVPGAIMAGIDMFLSRFLDNPYCDFCVERSPVGNDFAQMVMIARSELVFYDNRPVVGFGLDIDFEILGLGFRYRITDI